MHQTFRALQQLLLALDVKAPRRVVRRLLDTPVGNTLRGISDALDSLHIENCVYRLPEEYLAELEYPYLMVLTNGREVFAVVTNDSERAETLASWEGTVLAAKTTAQTPHFRHTWLNDIADWTAGHHLVILPFALSVALVAAHGQGTLAMLHLLLVYTGMAVALLLLREEYGNHDALQRFCKMGRHVDCEAVLNSRGSHIGKIARLSDLAFLYFSLLASLMLCAPTAWATDSLAVSSVGCAATLYSVGYQWGVLRKASSTAFRFASSSGQTRCC